MIPVSPRSSQSPTARAALAVPSSAARVLHGACTASAPDALPAVGQRPFVLPWDFRLTDWGS